MARTVIGDTVVQYLEKYPWHPSKTIAHLLARDHPKLFHSVEAARKSVTSYRGNGGKYKRGQKTLQEAGFFRPSGTVYDGLERLPQALSSRRAAWDVVRLDFKLALVLSDVHIPYHDPTALKLCLKHGLDRKVDCIIIDGDLMDFYRLSFWEQDPEARDFGDEVEMGKYVLELIRGMFPKAEIVFKEGNHEERLWRYLWARCPELVTVKDKSGDKPLVSLANVLDFEEYGITLVDEKRPVLAGKHLYLLHGHEFRRPLTNPVNPARGLYLRTKANALCGDMHQTSNHSEAGLDKVISCWSIGCLCDLHPPYMPLNKWTLGFATIELDGDGWSVENRKIINGRVV